MYLAIVRPRLKLHDNNLFLNTSQTSFISSLIEHTIIKPTNIFERLKNNTLQNKTQLQKPQQLPSQADRQPNRQHRISETTHAVYVIQNPPTVYFIQKALFNIQYERIIQTKPDIRKS